MTVNTRTDWMPDGTRQIELELTVGDQPWSTYVVTADTRDNGTVVEYEYTADRRFGLRRIPQRIVSRQYRDKVVEVHGYVVVERDERYGIAI